LVPEPTIGQRISRAKRTLAEAQVPFEVPDARERPARLSAILESIYLIFNEGYAATSGDKVLRPELMEDAMRLGRVLARLVPDESEAHGLIALMELQASRARARVSSDGEPVLLLDQDRTRWNRTLVDRGLLALEEARRTGGALGPYALQAAIAACHARAATAAETDWQRIAALYDALAAIVPSPVVELNRAVAVGMAFGPQAGLEIVERIEGEPAFRAYPLLASVRADLLEKLGRYAEARDAFRRAAELTQNVRQREVLLAKEQSLQDLLLP
jgi:predicted RNA polymerase sigma factor